MDCSLVLFCAFLLFTIIHCPQLSVLSTMSHHRNPLAYSSVYVPLDLRKRIVESWTLNEGNVWELSIRYKVGSQAIARYIDRYIQGHPLDSDFELSVAQNQDHAKYNKVLDYPAIATSIITQMRTCPSTPLRQYRDTLIETHRCHIDLFAAIYTLLKPRRILIPFD
eukprot:335514_1